MKKYLLLLLVAAALAPLSAQVTQYVDPMIGTAKSGHVYPGATVPFGMVQVSPDNGTEGWNWCSGYNYADSVIKGFSHTHFSGTGVGDLCDILVMPAVLDDPGARYTSEFSHAQEKAEPGYYSVFLRSFGIRAELSATARAGIHRYTFPKSDKSKIVIDLGHRLNSDHPTETQITIQEPSLVTGYRFSKGWAPNHKVFFAARFSSAPRRILLGDASGVEEQAGRSVKKKDAKAIFEFSTKEDEQILVKVGISGVSAEGALKNLDTEIPGWNFDSVRTQALALWERELSKSDVTSADTDLKKVYYTALYHTMLAPVIYDDVDGRYRGGDDQVHAGGTQPNYTIFSLWDTFRALHPLFTILEPERVDGFVTSMLAFKREYGFLPIWNFHANETMCMIGYHSIPVIADAYLKGFRGFDAKEAFKAMKHSAMSDREGLKWYRQYGYVPGDLEKESVSKTLEYAYDDWCIAEMARAMGDEADAKEFQRRSQFYRNVFDPTTRFMRGKLSSGEWRTPFDPLSVDHRANDYTEGNAWQYSWFVPHDTEGFIALLGGREKALAHLDSLFETKEKLTGDRISPDISGLIGQYAHGNEPSHHVAYLYAAAGDPFRTEARVSRIMSEMYKNAPDGLCGNDDCGQMSAWYIFSALGFYPFNPASQQYVLGIPIFDKASLHLPGGKTFTVERTNASASNTHVGAVSLNGTKLDRHYITHAEIMQGGTLTFEMTEGSK